MDPQSTLNIKMTQKRTSLHTKNKIDILQAPDKEWIACVRTLYTLVVTPSTPIMENIDFISENISCLSRDPDPSSSYLDENRQL